MRRRAAPVVTGEAIFPQGQPHGALGDFDAADTAAGSKMPARFWPGTPIGSKGSLSACPIPFPSPTAPSFLSGARSIASYFVGAQRNCGVVSVQQNGVQLAEIPSLCHGARFSRLLWRKPKHGASANPGKRRTGSRAAALLGLASRRGTQGYRGLRSQTCQSAWL